MLPAIPLQADVGRIWLNNAEITANPLQMALHKGWNHLEFTCYNQNNRARIRVPYALADLVAIMDSDGCE